jgi:DNA-binding CsgD family transcriptional regulator/sugar lactone lactonase YvrE
MSPPPAAGSILNACAAYHCRGPAGMTLNQRSEPNLSRREREVAALVAEGLTNRQIGERLFISERTVDGHLEHVREKLAVNTRAQIAAWYVNQSRAELASVDAPPARQPRSLATRPFVAIALLANLIVATVAVGLWLVRPTGPVITTVAGSTRGDLILEGGFSGDSGQATGAQLSRPSDVGLFGTTIYIADTDNGRIRMVDAQGRISTLAGGGNQPFSDGDNATSADIGPPVAVAAGPDGLTYFSNGSLLARINANLTLTSIPTGQISSVGGLCFAPDGSLYIADYYGDRVWVMRPNREISVYAGTGEHGFWGDNSSALAAHLSYPDHIAVDKDGNLYIADEGNNRIRRVDKSTGVISTVAGSSDTYGYSGDGGPAIHARLSLPSGVAVADNGDVYIADTGNNRVRKVDAKTHVITTVAGVGSPGFSGDGSPATQAALYGPVALALTSTGNLYVVDLGNHRIREIAGIAAR